MGGGGVREAGRPRCSQAVCRWRVKWACLFKALTHHLLLLLLFSPNWLFFFFSLETICPLSLSFRVSIFSLAPNEFYTRECTHLRKSEHQRGRRKNWMNTEEEYGGVGVVLGVLGPSVGVCAVAPCAHMYVWVPSCWSHSGRHGCVCVLRWVLFVICFRLIYRRSHMIGRKTVFLFLLSSWDKSEIGCNWSRLKTLRWWSHGRRRGSALTPRLPGLCISGCSCTRCVC